MSLELVIGCMYSGKSTEILRLAKRFKMLKRDVMLINNQIDTRYTNGELGFVSTHNLEKMECISAKLLIPLIQTQSFRDADVIIVEEAQFFNDLFDFVITALNEHNKHVIVSGLDGDSNKDPFGDILRLIPHAEKVKKLSALCLECNDGTEAFFSKRIDTENKDIVNVGAADKYIAVCRKHFNT